MSQGSCPPNYGAVGDKLAAPNCVRRVPQSTVRRTMKTLRFCRLITFYPSFNFGGDGIDVKRTANALAGAPRTIGQLAELPGCAAAGPAQTTCA